MSSPEAIKSFFEGKQVLIIDPTRKLRTLLKKMLVESGVSLNQMTFSEEFQESSKLIQEGRAQIVFSSMLIQNQSVSELVHTHVAANPDRSQALFFLIVDQNSMLAERLFRSLKVDGLFSPPLNGASVIDVFKKSVSNKIEATSESIQFYAALASYFSEQYEEAEELLSSIPNSSNSNIYALLGDCYHKRHNLEAAKDAYVKALGLDSINYIALEGLSQIYQEEKKMNDAYDLKKRFVSFYQVDQSSYPDLIRLSLSVGALDDVITYGEKYFEFEERTPDIQRSVAAGLAAVGKVIIRNDPMRGRDVLKKAALLGMSQPAIIESTLTSLVDNKHFSLAEEILNEAITMTPHHPGLQIVRLQLFARAPDTPEQVLVKARELMSRGVKSPEIYRIMIKTTMELGKKGTFLEDLIFEASRDYPELGPEFQAFKA